MEQDQENDYTQKFNGGVWKRIVKEFAFFKLLFISGLIFSGLEGISAIAQPKITNYVIDVFVKEQNLQKFIPVVELTSVFRVFAVLVTFFYIMAIGMVEVKMCNRLRIRCFNHLQSLSLSFYDANSVGSLMSRITSDINKV